MAMEKIKWLYLVSILIVLISCENSTLRTFDVEKFEKYVNNKENNSNTYYTYYEIDSTYIQQSGSWYGKYEELITYKGSALGLINIYYANGKLYRTNKAYITDNTDLEYGIRTVYNKKGRAIRKENLEKDIKVKFEDIYSLFKKRKIHPLDIFIEQHNLFWEVIYKDNNNDTIIERIDATKIQITDKMQLGKMTIEEYIDDRDSYNDDH